MVVADKPQDEGTGRTAHAANAVFQSAPTHLPRSARSSASPGSWPGLAWRRAGSVGSSRWKQSEASMASRGAHDSSPLGPTPDATKRVPASRWYALAGTPVAQDDQ
jgi:hypothetical protein